MKKTNLFLLVLIFINSGNVFSSSGRTNSQGCHNSSSEGYHCHNKNNDTNNTHMLYSLGISYVEKENNGNQGNVEYFLGKGFYLSYQYNIKLSEKLKFYPKIGYMTSDIEFQYDNQDSEILRSGIAFEVEFLSM